MLALVLSFAATAEPVKPEFEYRDFARPEDRIVAVVEKDRVVFTVSSPRGIGGATISLKAGEWPKDVVIVLTYGKGEGFRTLENFRLKTGRISATGSLGSTGKVTFEFLDAKGGREKLATGDSGGTLDIKVVKTEKGIELRFPPNLTAGNQSLGLFWIDAYRR